MITAWVPFTEITADIGPVTMIDGSHAWPEAEGLDFFSNDLDGQRRRFAKAGRSVDEVPMLMRRGQVSFHDWRTIHGSRPNYQRPAAPGSGHSFTGIGKPLAARHRSDHGRAV